MSKPDKYYFVHISVDVMCYEKQSKMLIVAKSSGEAERAAMLAESHNPDGLEIDPKGRAIDMGGEFVYSIDRIDEIPKEHFDIINKYKHSSCIDDIEFNEEDL